MFSLFSAMSDSSYAKTRFLYTHANASRAYPSRPANIDLIDDDWATDTLSDDDGAFNLQCEVNVAH